MLCTPLTHHSHLSPDAEDMGEKTNGTSESKTLDTASLIPQESRINTRNVNVCGGEKDILKYTFIQSLCEIKQQN